jgi:flavodoxin
MKILVVYDSVYGNTEQIARAIGGAITGDVRVLRADDASPADLAAVDLLVVGAPTQGGRPTLPVQAFLKKISGPDIQGRDIAAFDTRITAKWVGIFGYAAGKIGRNLKSKGGNLIVPPEPFFVRGTRGPLKEGELERAAGWAEGLVKSKK